MKILSAIAASTCVLFAAMPVLAQGDDASSSPRPLPPLAPPPTPACRLGEHTGIDDADASTAAQLVCTEIARLGPPPEAHYRVGLGKLGTTVILTATREGDAPGSTVDAREVRLQGIEEASVAAPRVADALVHGIPLADVDSSRANANARPPSKVHFALGLVGQFPPLDRSATPAPGVDFELLVDLAPFEVLGNFRFGADSTDRTVGVTFVDFSMGARYFPNDGDVSPYLGAGFAWSYFNVTDNAHNDFDGDHTGLGAYGEAGIEFLRTHHTHLAFGVRLDLPFYSLNNNLADVSPSSNGSGITTPAQPQALYYAPLSLELRLTF
jgi:hypothetical protein